MQVERLSQVSRLIFWVEVPLPSVHDITAINRRVRMTTMEASCTLRVTRDRLPSFVHPMTRLRAKRRVRAEDTLGRQCLFGRVINLVAHVCLLRIRFTLRTNFNVRATPSLFRDDRRRVHATVGIVFVFFLQIKLPLSNDRFIPMDIVTLVLRAPSMSCPRVPIVNGRFTMRSERMVVVLILVSVMVVLNGSLTYFQLLILMFIVFIVPRVVMVRRSIRAVLQVIRNVIPAHLYNVNFLPLIIVAITRRRQLRVPIRRLVIVSLPMTTMVRRIVRAMGHSRIIYHRIVSSARVNRVRVKTNKHVVIRSNYPPFIHHQLTRHALARLPTVVVFSSGVGLTQVRVRSHANVVAFLRSNSRHRSREQVDDHVGDE